MDHITYWTITTHCSKSYVNVSPTHAVWSPRRQLSGQWAGGVYSVDTLDKGMIRVPGGTEQEGTRFHRTTQNDVRFKTYKSFTSGMFHLIFWGHSWPWVTETMESDTADKGTTTVPTSLREGKSVFLKSHKQTPSAHTYCMFQEQYHLTETFCLFSLQSLLGRQ